MKHNYKKENKILWEVINDTLWMAIRNSHGTPKALSIKNQIKYLKLLNPNFKLRPDITIENDAPSKYSFYGEVGVNNEKY